MFEFIMCNYVKDVWLNYGDEVRKVCIQMVIIWRWEYFLMIIMIWYSLCLFKYLNENAKEYYIP